MKFRIALFILSIGSIISCKKKTTSDPTYPSSGLVSYYNFDDNLTDQKGNSPDGQNFNGTPFVPGKNGKALSFNGVDQRVMFDRKTFKSGNNVSVAFWFKSTDTFDIHVPVSCSDFVVTTNFHTGSIIFALTDPHFASGDYTPGTWTHFAGTYDGTNIKFYVNGVLKQTVTITENIEDGNAYLLLGDYHNVYWQGLLDDLFIYNKALTQSEVTQLYNYH